MSSGSGDVWTCEPVRSPFEATVRPPGSKSLTNRALALASLAAGPCTIRGVLLADDTRHMLENLGRLGMSLELDESAAVVRLDPGASVDFAQDDAELFCGNSGTTLRFLCGLLAAAGDATFVLSGEDRMHERPVGPLVELINELGGDVSYGGREGYPPLIVNGRGLEGGSVSYPAGDTLSSQYLSAVLMAAPYTRHEVRIRLEGRQASWPYVTMTMRMMDRFGVTPELERDPKTNAPAAIIVPRGRYRGVELEIEPDASAASYFLALAAIHPGSRITLEGLGEASLQGDVRFAEILRRMGCAVEMKHHQTTVTGPQQLDGVDADLEGMPDVAQTLAVAALFAVGETTLRGIQTLRVKETDRVAALASELEKLGAQVEVSGEGQELRMRITPPARVRGGRIATFDDHRMAMSFALAATKRRGIEIENPGCVSKTYPEYFRVLGEVVG